MEIKVLSLFDGISCARVALGRAGFEVGKYYASEIDKYAIKISQKNWPDIIQVGSVVGLDCSLFTDIDLLIGGSPCQDLSIAKKDRKGLSGERSGLFWEYVRILKEVKPKYFVLENVNSMPKEAKQVITETLGVEPIMINAALVSAQNRKRLFWTNIPNVALPEDRGILLRDILENNVSDEFYIKGNYRTWLDGEGGQKRIAKGFIKIDPEKAKPLLARDYANWSGNMIKVGQIGKGGQSDRIYSQDGKSVNLSANGGGRGAKTGLYLVKGVASRTYPRTKQDGVERKKQIEIRDDEKSNAMTSVSGDSMVMENYLVRKLTPIECERLQSLPDNYTAGVSNTQRYKALGNAFNCAVIKHILLNIKQ